MTLFESSLRKLNLPKCVMDDIVSIRNICMEAEQPQPAQPAQPQAAKQQNATTPQNNPQQAQPTANAQAQTTPQQGQAQPNAQGNPQAQGQAQPNAQGNSQEQGQPQGNQTNKQESQQENNLSEDQIDSKKLMAQFDNYLKGCQENVKKALTTQFGENANAIINEVNQYVKSNSPINFDEEIVPLLKVNGKFADQKVVDDVKQRLQKYFGLKIATAEQEPDEKKEQPQQQNAAQATQQPAQQQGKEQPAQPAVPLRSLSH